MNTEPESFHGRNRVSAKALSRVVSAITADSLGVAAKDVAVDLADDNGLLGVKASTPIRVRPLGRDQRSVLDRAADTQNVIRDRMLDLTGSSVGSVSVRLTAARTSTEGRTR
ncbi:hypothetical protein HD599_002640 [Conyzicola lurida]|uniref:Uncharacterized protein n=1 Tax=Conyzicola lurida TaxID=1172621 RepID=A0A841AM88_9MICO|nr:hypothetical protein [Conyzicola lurida]MBB5844317.1 hypothetical protein [Conyzicola lurida]